MDTRSAILPTAALILVLAIAPSPVDAQSGRVTVWNGVYSRAQAERGRAAYERNCDRCHAPDLMGVEDNSLLGDFSPRFSIAGPEFMERWREDRLLSLYDYLRRGMPPRNEPGVRVTPLPAGEYLDIIAHMMQVNGFPPGTRELNTSDLPRVRIEARDGPRPLPGFSFVQIVGCLTQFEPGLWQLSSAVEPVRIREMTAPTEQDTSAAAREPFGPYAFDLENLGYVGRDFSPFAHEGTRMLARGVLIRQPPLLRIDVRALVSLGQECE
jgi:cytochrome c5